MDARLQASLHAKHKMDQLAAKLEWDATPARKFFDEFETVTLPSESLAHFCYDGARTDKGLVICNVYDHFCCEEIGCPHRINWDEIEGR